MLPTRERERENDQKFGALYAGAHEFCVRVSFQHKRLTVSVPLNHSAQFVRSIASEREKRMPVHAHMMMYRFKSDVRVCVRCCLVFDKPFVYVGSSAFSALSVSAWNN